VLVVAALGINDFRNSSGSLEPLVAMRPRYRAAADGALDVGFQPAPNPHSQLRRTLAGLYGPLETVRFLQWLKAARDQTHADAGRPFLDIRAYEDPPPPDYAEAIRLGSVFLERLVREASASGSRVIVVYLPWSGESIDAEWTTLASRSPAASGTLDRRRPEQIVRRTAVESGARFASFSDHVASLAEEGQYELWHTEGDSHLTEAGNRALARFVEPLVREALDAPRRGGRDPGSAANAR
jgi:hypothetical protein